MNKLFALCLLLLGSVTLNAQHLSAGLRANASYRFRPVNSHGFELETSYGDHLNVSPEFFLRFNSKKRWAFEASFNRSTYRPPDIYGQYYELGQSIDTVVSKYKADYSELTVSGFYELKSSHLSGSAFFKRMHHFVGLSAGLTFIRQEESGFSPGGWGCFGGWAPPGYMHYEWKEIGLWTGINYNITFDVSKKLSLVGGSYFRFRPDVAFSSVRSWSPYTLAAQVGVQLGASYRIF